MTVETKGAMSAREKALDRVAKLLARAGSSNAHEAALAATRADEILKKHGISREEVEDHLDAMARAFEDAGPIGDDFWRIRIAIAVADKIRCRAVRKADRLIFEGSPKRAARAAIVYAGIARAIEDRCAVVYGSWGHPQVFLDVLRPILLEEAARAATERILGVAQAAHFPVPSDPQKRLLDYSVGSTGSAWCARMHMDGAKKHGRDVGLAVDLGGVG